MSKISSWTLVLIVSLLLLCPGTHKCHLQPGGRRKGPLQERSFPGATVTAVNVENGGKRETTTNGEGLYRFNFLPRGRYEVHASRPGSPWKR